jgi:hypothetical protein
LLPKQDKFSFPEPELHPRDVDPLIFSILQVAQAGLDEDINISQGNIRYFEPPPPQELLIYR